MCVWMLFLLCYYRTLSLGQHCPHQNLQDNHVLLVSSSLVIQHVYDTDCSCKFFVVAVLSLSLSNFIGCSCTTVLAAHSIVKSCHSVASTDCVQVEPKNYHAHNKRCSVQHFDLV